MKGFVWIGIPWAARDHLDDPRLLMVSSWALVGFTNLPSCPQGGKGCICCPQRLGELGGSMIEVV